MDCNIKLILQKFDKKTAKNIESDVRWRDLVQLYKKTDKNSGSRDLEVLNDVSNEADEIKKGLFFVELSKSLERSFLSWTKFKIIVLSADFEFYTCKI